MVQSSRVFHGQGNWSVIRGNGQEGPNQSRKVMDHLESMIGVVESQVWLGYIRVVVNRSPFASYQLQLGSC
jgi:hypothetical protein